MVPRTRPTIAQRPRLEHALYLRLGFAFVCCGGLLAVQLRATSRNGASAGRREPRHRLPPPGVARADTPARQCGRRLSRGDGPCSSRCRRRAERGRATAAAGPTAAGGDQGLGGAGGGGDEQAAGDAAAPVKELHGQPTSSQRRRRTPPFRRLRRRTPRGAARRGDVRRRAAPDLGQLDGAAGDVDVARLRRDRRVGERGGERESEEPSLNAHATRCQGAGRRPRPLPAAQRRQRRRRRRGGAVHRDAREARRAAGDVVGASSRQQRLWDQLDRNTIDPELTRPAKAGPTSWPTACGRRRRSRGARRAQAAAPHPSSPLPLPPRVPPPPRWMPRQTLCRPLEWARRRGHRQRSACAPPRATPTSRRCAVRALLRHVPVAALLHRARRRAGLSAWPVTSSLGSLFGGGSGGRWWPRRWYWVYMTFDEGDKFFDDPARESEAVVARRQHGGAAAAAGRHAAGRASWYKNTMRKPGPAFNFADGCRDEDGTSTVSTTTPSSSGRIPAVATLASYSPPNVGVVGLCSRATR